MFDEGPITPRDSTAGVEPIPVPPMKAIVHKAKIMLGLPWMKSVSPLTTFAIMKLIEGKRVSLMVNHQDAFIAHTRNRIVDEFLRSTCEWLLQVDDDTIPPFGHANWYRAYTGSNVPDEFAGMNALDRLMSHKKSIVGGLYFGRHPKGAAMYNEGAGIPKEAAFARQAPIDLIKPTRWVATGCLLTHRSVFEDIEKRFPRLKRGADGTGGNWFTSTEHETMERLDALRDFLSSGAMTGEKCLKAFQMAENMAASARANSGLGMGEDVALCVRAAAAGHVPHIDFGCVVGHIGHSVYGPWNTAPR